MLLLICEGSTLFSRAARRASQEPQVATRTVQSFDVDGTNILDALLQLGRQMHIPLGIEYLNPADLQRRVTVHVKGGSVGKIVQAILGERTAYRWDTEGTVIHVVHPALASGEQNLLDHVLREFAIRGRTDLVTAATVTLPGQLEREISPPKPSPGVAGEMGSILGGRPEDQVGPLTMRSVTARQVLNRLVSEGNKAAWVVLVPPAQLSKLPARNAWFIIAYDDPRRDWGVSIAPLLQRSWQPESTRGRK